MSSTHLHMLYGQTTVFKTNMCKLGTYALCDILSLPPSVWLIFFFAILDFMKNFRICWHAVHIGERKTYPLPSMHHMTCSAHISCITSFDKRAPFTTAIINILMICKWLNAVKLGFYYWIFNVYNDEIKQSATGYLYIVQLMFFKSLYTVRFVLLCPHWESSHHFLPCWPPGHAPISSLETAFFTYSCWKSSREPETVSSAFSL